MAERPEYQKKPAQRLKSVATLSKEVGKIPPQAIEVEQAVLGALMLDRNALSETMDSLDKEYFYDPRHVYIFEAIKELDNESQAVDLLTVTNQLKKNAALEAAGGMAYLSHLTSRVSSSAHIEFHARVVVEKHIKREMIRLSGELMQMAFDESNDLFDIMNTAEERLFKISQNNTRKEVVEMGDAMRDALDEIELATKNSDGISGVPTGFKMLDKLTSGWQKSDMIVIAARPAMGKTAFVLSMTRNIAVDYNMGVAVFSLEMSAVQLVKRLISSESKISADKLRKGDLKDDELQQLYTRVTKLSKAPIFIDDTPGISVYDLRTKCRQLKKRHDIQIVIIDYLQLMTAGKSSGKGPGNREQEISTISRTIKEIAKELNVPIIALSQLSRSVEIRGGDKKPQLSDLRESGAIEQDADIVTFLYRPEYYQLLGDNNENVGIGEVIVAKHRNGGLDNIRLRFVKEYARFENLDDARFDQNDFMTPGRTLAMNQGFDQEGAQSYTVPSKMNDFKDNSFEDDFSSNGDEDTPF